MNEEKRYNYKTYSENLTAKKTYEILKDMFRDGICLILKFDAEVTIYFNDNTQETFLLEEDESPFIIYGNDDFRIHKITLNPTSSSNIKLMVW